MTTTLLILEFSGSLAMSFIASLVLSKRIEQVAAWLGCSELSLGIVTALGADSPEIASAITAMVKGHHDLGFGVIFGSNIFNLAALIGLSAVVAGRVRIGRNTLLLNGIVAIWVTSVVVAMSMAALSTPVVGILLAIVLLPYLTIASLRPSFIRRIGMPWLVSQPVEKASREARRDQRPANPTRIDMLSIASNLGMIVVSSVGLVHATVALGGRWNIPHIVIGTLVLAGLTGIPNVVAAIRLAVHHRGSAVVSEALNSNTFNLLVGAYLPALLMGVTNLSPQAIVVAWWLLTLTILTLTVSWLRRGLHRIGGEAPLLVYLVFVAFIIPWRIV